HLIGGGSGAPQKAVRKTRLLDDRGGNGAGDLILSGDLTCAAAEKRCSGYGRERVCHEFSTVQIILPLEFTERRKGTLSNGDPSMRLRLELTRILRCLYKDI